MAHDAVLITQRAKYKAGAAMAPGQLTVYQTRLLWQPVQGIDAQPVEVAVSDITREHAACGAVGARAWMAGPEHRSPRAWPQCRPSPLPP